MKIAIVGNSPILLEKEYGEEIDQHDIVVRFNKFITKNYEKYTGVKTTDICFNMYTDRNDEILKISKEHRFFFYTIEQFNILDNTLRQKYNNELTISDVNILDNQKYYIQLRNKLHAENNWQGSSGLIMCQYFVDNFPNDIIDVYGITFFKDTKIINGKKIIQHLNGQSLVSGHDQNAEWAYYETYLKDKINLHL